MRSRGRDILLLAVAVVALAVAVYTFVGKPKRAPAAAPSAALSEATPAPEPTSAAGKEASAEGQPGESAEEGGQAARNPFSAPGASAPVAPEVKAPEPGAAEAGAQQPAGEEKPASAALRLTGIVVGKPTLAVIRGNGERYLVRVGDQIGDGYRVQAIGRQEVVLAGPRGQVILTMGGRQ